MIDDFKADIDRYVFMGEGSPLWVMLTVQGAWASAAYRYARWVVTRCHIPGLRALLFTVALCWRKLIQIVAGIDLPPDAEIGKGLYIGHFGGIIVGSGVKMGENCNLSQGVTLGYAGRAGNRGCPTLGDRVYVGAGAKVIGPINVGNDAAIGANAVVTKNLPDRAVAVGIPAKVINLDGSSDFVRFRARNRGE